MLVDDLNSEFFFKQSCPTKARETTYPYYFLKAWWRNMRWIHILASVLKRREMQKIRISILKSTQNLYR